MMTAVADKETMDKRATVTSAVEEAHGRGEGDS
jgi:hypothetical protein